MPVNRTQDPTKLRHPAVVWNNEITGDDDFLGIMLSKSGPDRFPNNVPMKPNHLSAGFYNNTHFVNQRFIKLAGWGPFEKVSNLTVTGIAFIEQNLSDNPPLPFDAYLESLRT